MRVLLLFTFVCFISTSFAQHGEKTKLKVKKNKLVILKDTSFVTHRDTTLYLSQKQIKVIKIKENPVSKSDQFYDTLKSRASQTKITDGIADLVLKKKRRKTKVDDAIEKSEKVFRPFSEYTIGNISFKAVDLLEGSVTDTLETATTKFGKFINKVHRDTRGFIIEQNLLFHSGDKVDPYQLADNERILRQFRTLRDARILLKVTDKKNRIVDIVVVTQDVASIGFSGDYSSLNKFRLDVYDINILGLAKQFQISYYRSSNDIPNNGFGVTIRDPNIRSTFIQSELQYTYSYERTQTRFSLARDFFTPQIKYAGGIDLYTTDEKFYFEDTDTLEMPYNENNVDVWLGRSFQVGKRSNLINSFRVNVRDFFQKPFTSADSNSFFFDRTLFLGSLTLIKRNYMKSSLIRGFGRTEDVPIGGFISVLLGQEVNEFYDRNYFEIRSNGGKYFSKYGYFSGGITLGTFIKKGSTEDGIFTANISYFSDLFKINRVQSRQFVNMSYTMGINRVLDKTIGLDGKWLDANSLSPYGLERFIFGAENVYFMPWYTYGFRFAFYHNVNVNVLTTEERLFKGKNFFTSIGAGVRMLNENLVFPTFTLDFTYFVGNKLYSPDFQIKFSTQLKKLFGNDQVFKPTVTGFQ
ncbi:MAG TPA: hypothetical protein PLJ60_10135 [Chryseolinea sp.]|nr:hypothetical protein [Chryseolinea sp.]HPH45846.1 hypothetical protein [Chryseolinea sp.]HPM30682.1 hypothetical protein [Chryseolinea sp.]